MAKKKHAKTDGLGPREIEQIRNAVRLVWQRCFARSLVIKRCLNKETGFSNCEACNAVVAKVKVDHIKNVGKVDEGFITRMFVPSSKLQGWCDKCHNKKTAQERKDAAVEAAGEWFD